MTDLNDTAAQGSAPQDQRTLALIAHLLGIVTYFVGPLIIWLISKDDANKSFVIDQAKEALNFQITLTIAFVISVVLMMISFGLLFFLPTLVWFVNLVMSILGGIKANEGVAYRYPFAIRLIK